MTNTTTTWLLLRGLTRETRHWGDFPQMLKSHVADANVIAIDLPGNGTLHLMRSPTSVVEMAGYVRGELLRRGLKPPYNIVAMSLGAMVTAAWATQYPQELSRCVLINTSMRPFSAFYERLRPANYPLMLRLALPGGTPQVWEQAVLHMTSGQPRKNAGVLACWIRWRNEFPVSRTNALRQLLAAAAYRAPAKRPVEEVLVLTSAHDQLVSTRCSQALAAAWDVPVAVHPDAGHDIPLDDAEWVARQIAAWLVRARVAEAKSTSPDG